MDIETGRAPLDRTGGGAAVPTRQSLLPGTGRTITGRTITYRTIAIGGPDGVSATILNA